VILNCTRQWGKSTVTAAKALHQGCTYPGSLTLVVSPSGRQSGEFLRKAEEFAARLEIKAKGDGDNEISLLLPNRSRIVGLPGNEATVRGFSAVSLLVVDEASRVEDDLYRALRPMLAVSGGSLWLMSTPYGKRGFFWETWNGQRPLSRGETPAGTSPCQISRDTKASNAGWERVQVKASDCPRIQADFLEEERATLGEQWFRQEYECEFVDGTSGLFGLDMVEAAIREDVEPLDLGARRR